MKNGSVKSSFRNSYNTREWLLRREKSSSTNIDFGPPEEALDLSTCDREPIHIPGSVQPHRVLLSVDDRSLAVLQASENVQELFGRDILEVLGASLPDLLGPAKAAEINRGLQNPFLQESSIPGLLQCHP